MTNPKDAAVPDDSAPERRDGDAGRRMRKRNRDVRTRRRGAAVGADGEGWLSPMAKQRVMPRDERERRRTLEERMAGGAAPSALADGPDVPDGPLGRVLEVSTSTCRVWLDHRILVCTLRGSLTAFETGDTNVVAVGDRIVVRDAGGGQGVVERILARTSEVARPDPLKRHIRQVIAANADQVLVLAAWRQPSFWPELVDRYLVAAERSRVQGILCVNKIDLAASLAEVEETVGVYRALGYPVLLTSAVRGDGVDDVRALLAGRQTVLVGLSGVGKSALLSAAQPGLALPTGAVNERRGQGRHTTTQAIMIPFGEDSWVIDTAGIREFGLVGLRQGDLIGYYPELAAVASACRFRDCGHVREPGCAVRAAVDAGSVSAMRLDSFLKIRESLPP